MGYRDVLVLLATIPFLVTVGSLILGERIEVVSLRTVDGVGHTHDTKLWIVDHDGRPWVRGVRPTLRWIERIRMNPRVELIREGKTTACTASIVETAEAIRAIDEAMASKYGWLDAWYEFAVRHDTIPIRLDPDGTRTGR